MNHSRLLVVLSLLTACTNQDEPFELVSLTATPDSFVEQQEQTLTLTAEITGTPDTHRWLQVSGPPLPLTDNGPTEAVVDLSGWTGATDIDLMFTYEADADDTTSTKDVEVTAYAEDMISALGERMEMGGSTTDLLTMTDALGTEWTLFNVANRLKIMPTEPGATVVAELPLEGMIHDIDVVDYDGTPYAILAVDDAGVAVVDLSDPSSPVLVTTVAVNFEQDGLTFTEGGGEVLTNNIISGTRSVISATETDGTNLWIANFDYGIQRTSLSNLMGEPSVEADGTLLIEQEAFALQFAGENPWGGPRDMMLHGDRLLVAQGELGLVVYDTATLSRVAGYNLFTDPTVAEDWFVDQNLADEAQPGFLDPVTGMPSYDQVSFEILSVWKGGVDAPTPWADFDRYGKYYYMARDVDVVDLADQSIAYIAYGLGGMVAVDITGYAEADPANAPLVGTWLGYVPAVPAHGPDEPTGSQSESILPHFGSGMLKESGVVDVAVHDQTVWFTDHFAGLLALREATDPSQWHGAAAPYDNDDPTLGDGVLGDHWPDYEFVTSWDMSPYDPSDHESLPAFMFEAPFALVTGEVGGHGSRFQVLAGADPEGVGGMDVLLGAGAGGLSVLDTALADGTHTVLDYYPGTDEVGAAADGSPTQPIPIGHTAGVAVSDHYLYVADGPHGLSAWELTDETGLPTADFHLVANTVQDEYPVTVGSTTVYPTTHAYGVILDDTWTQAWTSCQTVGARRVEIKEVQEGGGVVGAPLLLTPQPTDFFEHNSDYGKPAGLHGQDHAYDVELMDDLAFVADGSNGLTIYDTTKDPTDMQSGYFVANIGNDQDQPGLGRATGVDLWQASPNGPLYAFVAAGPRGIGVVDVSDPANPQYVKVFEPIKIEDGKVGHADGRGADVSVLGDHVLVAYDSFGMVLYAIDDLIEPVPDGVDPRELWSNEGGTLQFDHRPEAIHRFKLSEQAGFEEAGGGALKFMHYEAGGSTIVLASYGTAGLVRLDWSDPAAPVLLDVADTVGEAQDVATLGGWVYVADGSGGIAVFH